MHRAVERSPRGHVDDPPRPGQAAQQVEEVMWLEGSVLCAGGGDRTGKGRDGLPASTWRALGAAVLQCVHVLCVCVQAAAASRRPTFCVCVCVLSCGHKPLSLSSACPCLRHSRDECGAPGGGAPSVGLRCKGNKTKLFWSPAHRMGSTAGRAWCEACSVNGAKLVVSHRTRFHAVVGRLL